MWIQIGLVLSRNKEQGRTFYPDQQHIKELIIEKINRKEGWYK